MGDKQARIPDDWTRGFRTGNKKGMTCDICRCVVRQNPGDAEAHRAWHAKVESH